MDEIFGILISLIVDLVIVVLCAGFIGCMFCSDLGIEFDGGMWFLSVIVCVLVVGVPGWLLYRYIDKKWR